MSEYISSLKKFSSYSEETQSKILEMAEVAFGSGMTDSSKMPSLPDYQEVLNQVEAYWTLDRFLCSSRFGVVNAGQLPSIEWCEYLAAIIQEINVASYVNRKNNGIFDDCEYDYYIGLGMDGTPVSSYSSVNWDSKNPAYRSESDCQEAIAILLNIDPDWAKKRFRL